MSRRYAFGLFICSVVFVTTHAAADQPNIVFVLADDMGPGDVACYGSMLAPTPNVDRMAAESFWNALATKSRETPVHDAFHKQI